MLLIYTQVLVKNRNIGFSILLDNNYKMCDYPNHPKNMEETFVEFTLVI